MARQGDRATPGIADRMGDFVASGVHATTDRERREAGVRPTGQDHFDSLSPAEQDEMVGPAAAEKIRAGEATLADFVQRDGGFIRQRPVEDT